MCDCGSAIRRRRIFQAAVGAAPGVPVFRIGRRMFGTQAGIGGAAIAAVHPGFVLAVGALIHTIGGGPQERMPFEPLLFLFSAEGALLPARFAVARARRSARGCSGVTP